MPDAAVAEAAERLPADPAPHSAVVHTSGLLPLRALAGAGDRGWAVGGFHPLRPFPAPQPPPALHGVTFGVDASTPELLDELMALAARLGGRARRVTDAARPLYHAAAVLGSNYVVALAAEAADALEQVGWSRGEAVTALLPLLRGAVDSLEQDGLPAALTGPIRRGDAAAVRAHLAALERIAHASVYRILGSAALQLARDAGLDEEAARRIQEALTG